MTSDLRPAMLRSVQRLAAGTPMARLARSTEEQLRNGHSVNLRQFATAYYPLSFVTGETFPVSVLQWLFPASCTDETVEKSPLGELTQMFVIAEGLLRHLSGVGSPEALELVLAARVFVEDSEAMTDTRRQHALNTALRCAQNEDIVKMLIAHGADPQAILDGLEEKPFPVNRPSVFQSNAAPLYAENGVFVIGNSSLLRDHIIHSCSSLHARGLVDAGVDVANVMTTATKCRHIGVMRTLCENMSIDMDYCPPGETTALIYAITLADVPIITGREPSRLHVVGALIRLGADVNARGRDNKTALIAAIRRGNDQVVEVLLRHGANPNLSDDDGRSALHHANSTVNGRRYVEQLLKHGADPDLLDGRGRKPLDELEGGDGDLADVDIIDEEALAKAIIDRN